jgi:tetratricopeptide (TPR) repeat protein
VIRDHLISSLFGVLVGFVAAYFMYEAISDRQPERLPAAQAAASARMEGATAAPGVAAPTPRATEQRRLVTQIESFLDSNPGEAEAWLQLAHLSYELQDWARAVGAYQRYLELAPPDPDILSDLGVSLRGVGRREEALAAFDRAQELAPQHWQSRFNEVVVLAFDLGRLDAAAAVIDELRSLQPDNPDVERLAAEVEKRRRDAA